MSISVGDEDEYDDMDEDHVVEGDFEVYLHFRTLSTNQSHPRAVHPRVSLDTGLGHSLGMQFPMSVMGNSVGALCEWLTRSRVGFLFVFDWCTGALLMVWKFVLSLSYTEFILLSLEHKFVFFCVH
jgi:hypothetical protein